MHDSIKMNHLIEWSKMRKLGKEDVNFILSNLSLEQRKQFQKIYNLKEKTIKEKIVDDKRFKRNTLSVFNGVEFCAELSVAYGRMNPNKRIAILDTDRLNPRIHFYLNCESHVKNMYHHLSREQSTGLNLLIDALHKNQLTSSYTDHMAIKLKGLRNVFYFSGSSLIEDYEYFDLADFKKIVQFLKDHYDVLLLNTNGFIYDAYTCYALITSDLNLLPVKGQWPEVKSLKKSIDFLCLKQNIDKRKHYYVLFDHEKHHNISSKSFAILMNAQNIYPVPYLRSRHMSQERVYIPIKKYNRKLQNTYYQVLKDIDRGIRKYELSQKSSH